MLLVALVLDAGWNTPASRNGLMFDIRSSEDADGDSRIMGSRRRWLDDDAADGFLRPLINAGLPAAEDGGGRGSCAEG